MSILNKMFGEGGERRVYCDYAAATPLSSTVLKELEKQTKLIFANPSAIHKEGQAAKRVLESSRELVASVLKVRPAAVTFTASGTESNNLALSGYLEALVAAGRTLTSCTVLTTKIEHPSVLKVLQTWQQKGLNLVYLPLNEVGQVTAATLESHLTPATVLLSLTYANSEIGIVQDVRRLSRVVRSYEKANNIKIVFHLDAAQAPLWLSCEMEKLAVDMMSLDAGKFNGPRVGLLIKKSSVNISPVLYGGGQESGLRSGTENTPQIAAAALAFKEAQDAYENRSNVVYKLSLKLKSELTNKIPGIIFNGPEFTELSQLERLPNNVHISLPGFDSEYAVVFLDNNGIATSTKSACSGAGGGESQVVKHIYHDSVRASSTIRFSIDPTCSLNDMTRVADELSKFVNIMKKVDQ